MSSSVKVLIKIVSTLVCMSCSANKAEEPVLSDTIAVINDKRITTQQFENAYSYYYRKTGYVLEPNSKNRNDILNAEFDKLILAQAAQDNGYELKPEIIFDSEIIKRQYLIDLYQKKMIEETIVIDEKEVRETYLRVNTVLTASHLYAPTLDSILSIQNLIESNVSFEKLAKMTFKNPYLASNGGYLGEVKFDEMDIAFEDMAYKTPVNSISAPVKTAQGYSIIKVHTKFRKPVITENEYNSMADRLRTIAIRRVTERKKRAELEQFISKVEVNQTVLNALWNKLNHNLSILTMANVELEGFFSMIANSESTNIASYNGVEFSSSSLLRELYYSPVNTRGRIRDFTTFTNVIKGLAYRCYQLNEVDKNNLLSTSDYTERIKYAQLMNMANAYLSDVRNSISVEELAIVDYYQKNSHSFEEPLKLNLVKVVVSTSKKANEVLKSFQQDVSVGEILKKYTEDSESLLKEGLTGLTPIQSFGTAALKLNKLKVGDVSPIIEQEENVYHIYKCVDRVEPKLLSFSEAREFVKKTLIEQELKKVKAKIVEQVSKKHNAQIFTEKIQTLALKLN